MSYADSFLLYDLSLKEKKQIYKSTKRSERWKISSIKTYRRTWSNIRQESFKSKSSGYEVVCRVAAALRSHLLFPSFTCWNIEATGESVHAARGDPLRSSVSHFEPRTPLSLSLWRLDHWQACCTWLISSPKRSKSPSTQAPFSRHFWTVSSCPSSPACTRRDAIWRWTDKCKKKKNHWSDTNGSSGPKSSPVHRCVTDPPHPYTSGKCGTCNVAESGTEKTTVFSAGPPCTPKGEQAL